MTANKIIIAVFFISVFEFNNFIDDKHYAECVKKKADQKS